MRVKHRTDRKYGRVEVRAEWGGRPCTVTRVISRARLERRGARFVGVIFDDAPRYEVVRYSSDVRTADGRPVMLTIRRIAAERARERQQAREVDGAPIKRARRNVERARASLAAVERRIRRLETAAASWRRKIAARERALSDALDRAAATPTADEIMARMSGLTTRRGSS